MLPARSALTPEPNQGGGILFQKAKLMLFFILKDRGKKCQEEIETRRNRSVTGGRPLRIKVGRKGKVVPWPGGPGGPLGTMSGDFFVEGAGARASRLFWQRFRTFFEFLPIPADSGAYRPDPPATTKPAPGPP